MEGGTRFYKIDTRKLSLAECWRLSPGLGFLVLALLKVLHIPLSTRTATARPDRLILVDEAELDLEGRRGRLDKYLGALSAEGFERQFLHRHHSITPDGSTLAVVYLSGDGLVYAVLLDAFSERMGVKVTQTSLGLLTPIAGGKFLATSDDRGFDTPEELVVERGRRGKPARLLARHRERLATAESVQRFDPAGLQSFVLHLEQMLIDYHRARGVFVEMTPTQVEKLRRAKPQRRGGWKLFGWLGIWKLWPVAIALTLLLNGMAFWGDGGEFWQEGETPAVVDCAAVAAAGQVGPAVRPAVPPPQRESSPPTLVAQFGTDQDAAAAAESLAAGHDSADEAVPEVTRVGALLLVRTPSADVGALAPFARRFGADGAAVQLDHPEEGRAIAFKLSWPAQSPATLEATEELEAYLLAPPAAHLIPAWAPPDAVGAAISAEQAAARRAFLRLSQPPEMGYFTGVWYTVTSLWELIFGFADTSLEDYAKEEQERTAARARRMAEEDPEVDAETTEEYLRWTEAQLSGWTQSDDPFAEAEQQADPREPVQRLGRYLGQLPLETDSATGVQSPSLAVRAYSAGGGGFETHDDRTGLWYLTFEDIPSGLPALAGHLCHAGAGEVRVLATGAML